jgi:hypothetical protein
MKTNKGPGRGQPELNEVVPSQNNARKERNEMLLECLLRTLPNDALIYLEQNVNHLFQRGDRESEVSSPYQPERGVEYKMPYVLLSLSHPDLEYFEAQPNPKLVRGVRRGGQVKFFIHPDMIPEYRGVGLSELLDFAGEISVSPTASTRTVMTRNFPYNFMVKINMTKKIGLLRRKLTRSSVAQSNQIMSEMAQVEDEVPTGLAYLPESMGVVFQETIGEIFRECQARPKVESRRYLIPFFSLISRDYKRPEDPLLLCQIVEGQNRDPYKAFYKGILVPLLETWSYLVLERGILPVAHLQNLLLEINRDGKPTRIVFRDLQDAAIDGQVRRKKGLHTDFARHFIDDVTHTPLLVNGELVKNVEIVRQIRYSLAYDFWLGLLIHCFSVVLSKYSSCGEEKIRETAKEFFQQKIQPKADDIFPPEQFAIQRIDPVDTRTRLVENKGKPIYR